MARVSVCACLVVGLMVLQRLDWTVAHRAADEIKHLPGWNHPLPSKMYSGYVPAGSDNKYEMFEHYVFVECEHDPANAPLLVWTNGGPGASSMFGLFVELGPFMLTGASLKTAEYNASGVPSLFYNENSWTKVANVLIINSPPPVGYSYCNPAGPAGNGYSCGDWDDARTAVHNKAYLENWLAAFPHYEKNDWYIVGESYAGIYVPTLVRALLEDKDSKVAHALKGFAVGDGCVGNDVLCGANGPGPYFDIKFMNGHGQFSDKLFNEIMDERNCPRAQLIDGKDKPNAKCQALINEAYQQVGGFYAYNLYDDCWYQNNLIPPHHMDFGFAGKGKGKGKRSYWGPPTQEVALDAINKAKQGPLGNEGYPCGGPGALFTWVAHPKVKAALNVPADAAFFSGDDGVGFNYTLTEQNLLPFYKEVVENTNLRVLVYNGDTDPGINSFVAQNWTSFLGFPEKEPWRAWTLDGKQFVGGYVTRYENDFDFLTIRGSGHMVPEYKPRAALSFITAWLKNEDWPRYVAPKPALSLHEGL